MSIQLKYQLSAAPCYCLQMSSRVKSARSRSAPRSYSPTQTCKTNQKTNLHLQLLDLRRKNFPPANPQTISINESKTPDELSTFNGLASAETAPLPPSDYSLNTNNFVTQADLQAHMDRLFSAM